jgi:hypothetical protein
LAASVGVIRSSAKASVWQSMNGMFIIYSFLGVEPPREVREHGHPRIECPSEATKVRIIENE